MSNGFTSALETDGKIEWFPCPKFDSDSIFTSILDEQKGGFFSIAPEGKYTLETRYLGKGLAVSNTFRSAAGTLAVKDFMPLGLPAIIRIYESDMPFTLAIQPVFEFGLINPAVEERKGEGFIFRNPKGKDGLEVNIKGEYTVSEDAAIQMQKGKGAIFALYSKDLKYGLFSRHGFVYADPYESFRASERYWRAQVSMAKPVSSLIEAYERSIAVVLGMLYLPSGAIIASPTTSLPEQIGSPRNWDYRYVWIRDASYASEALSKASLHSKSRRILSFLISVIDPSSKSFDHPLFSIDGTSPKPEETLHWLRGYRNSRPVRIGNEAYTQVQSDIEGAFMNALHLYLEKSKDLQYAQENFWAVESILNWVSKSWRSKSVSLWEERQEPEHFVHTKVMCWVAADRASKIALMVNEAAQAKEWTELAHLIKDEIMEKGFSKEKNSFVKNYGSGEIDASLLTLPIYGFISPSDGRFLATLSRIEKELVVGEGLIRRYPSDFLGKAEHPFTLLTTWLARIYIRLGKLSEAERILENLASYSSEHMLIGEHVDLLAKEARGNFPQLFPHAGMVDAITELEDAKSLRAAV